VVVAAEEGMEEWVKATATPFFMTREGGEEGLWEGGREGGAWKVGEEEMKEEKEALERMVEESKTFIWYVPSPSFPPSFPPLLHSPTLPSLPPSPQHPPPPHSRLCLALDFRVSPRSKGGWFRPSTAEGKEGGREEGREKGRGGREE